MMNQQEWEKLATPSFITARQMILVCIVLEIIVGVMFVAIAKQFGVAVGDFLWWVLQFFGLVVATNLAAVILAVLAQKTANDIGDMYRRVFTADFYLTLNSMTTFRTFLMDEAEKDGRTFDDEMQDIAVKVYRVARAQLDVKAAEIEPIDPLGEHATDEELFGDDTK